MVDRSMSLARDIRSDIKAAKKIWLPWWGVLCLMIGSLPVFLLLDHFGELNFALPVLNSILVLGFVVALKRVLWQRVWFWMTMTVIVALHVPLILFVPWTSRWVPALAIGAIDAVDLIVILAILAVVGNLVEKPKIADG